MLAGQNWCSRSDSHRHWRRSQRRASASWATRANTPPVGLFHQLDFLVRGRWSYFALGDVKMVGVPGNAPGLGTDLVRCGV
jgi:hypothetical protein